MKKKRDLMLKNCYSITPKIEEAKKIIEKKGGTLITNPDSIDMLSKFEVKCEKEHIWGTCLKNLKRGFWCKLCRFVVSKSKKNKSSEKLKTCS